MPKKTYPRLSNIKDQDIKESLRLLWDKMHSSESTATTLQEQLATAQATIDSQNTTITKLNQQVTRLSPAYGTDMRNPVPLGSGGTSGGAQPPPPPPPSGGYGPHADVVAQAKADLIAAGVSISGDCGAFEIVKLVAWRLKDTEPQIGLFNKPTGTNCDGYNTSNVFYNTGLMYDILQDAGGANGPQWNYNGTANVDEWRAPIAPAI